MDSGWRKRMYQVIKTLHFLGFAWMVGVPLLYFATARFSTPEVVRHSQRWVRYGLVVGSVFFVGAGAADVARVTLELFGLLDAELLQRAVTQTRYGQISLTRSLLALAFATAAWVVSNHVATPASATTSSEARVHRGIGQRWAPSRLLLAALGVATAAYTASTSHSGSGGHLGALLADAVHLMAMAAWVGALTLTAVLPWHRLHSAELETARSLGRWVEWLSNLGIGAVTLLGLTGFYMALLQIYGLPALTGTSYGQAFLGKMALLTVALGAAGVNHLYFRRALTREGEAGAPGVARTVRRFQATVRLEAVLLTGVIGMTGWLATQPPPQEPIGLVAPVNVRELIDGARMDIRFASDAEGVTTMNLRWFDSATPVTDGRISIRLSMPQHAMGTQVLQAEHARDGLYQALGVLTMGGEWRADVTLERTGRDSAHVSVAFEAASGTMDRGRVSRLVPAAAWREPDRRGGAALAALLLVVGGVGGAYVLKRPTWRALVVPAAWLMGFAVYSGALTMTMQAFPTTFQTNPVIYSGEMVARGQALYEAHCLVCHGVDGKGDGPGAMGLNPRPASFLDAHVDLHTDGDLFWWISHGIPGTGMPPFETVLTEEERWLLIHHVRNFRLQALR